MAQARNADILQNESLQASLRGLFLAGYFSIRKINELIKFRSPEMKKEYLNEVKTIANNRLPWHKPLNLKRSTSHKPF